MKGRLYDPKLGRFITPDPFVTDPTAPGLNRYAYVRNNPLSYVDPMGFQEFYQGTSAEYLRYMDQMRSQSDREWSRAAEAAMKSAAYSAQAAQAAYSAGQQAAAAAAQRAASSSSSSAAAAQSAGEAQAAAVENAAAQSAAMQAAASREQAAANEARAKWMAAASAANAEAGFRGGDLGQARERDAPRAPSPTGGPPQILPRIPLIPMQYDRSLPALEPPESPGGDDWSAITFEKGWELGLLGGASDSWGAIEGMQSHEKLSFESGSAMVGLFGTADVTLWGTGFLLGPPEMLSNATSINIRGIPLVSGTFFFGPSGEPLGVAVSLGVNPCSWGVTVGLPGGPSRLAPAP